MGDYHVLMQFDVDAEPDVVRRALDTEEGIRLGGRSAPTLVATAFASPSRTSHGRSSSRSAMAQTGSNG